MSERKELVKQLIKEFDLKDTNDISNMFKELTSDTISAFLFVDCVYVTLRQGNEAKEYAVYTILGFDLTGKKEILGLWLSESESKNY